MQKLSFQSKDYNRILFSSDFHIDHMKNFLWEARGFKDWKSHTDFILDSLRSLKHNDLLFFLGDFALNTSDERIAKVLNEIPCDTYMCFGNHNSAIKAAYQKAKAEFMEENKFYSNCDFYPLRIAQNVFMMGEQFLVSIDGKKIFCCHFPWKVWDGQQHGWMHCHGHNHSNLAGSQPNDLDNGKILDCGVDNALKYNGTAFFSFQEIVEIMNKKPIKLYDHHGEARQ